MTDKPQPCELVITGAGALTSLGDTTDQLLTALDEGRRGFEATDLAGILPENAPPATGLAARVGPFDVSAYVPPMKARRLDRASLFAVVAARQALEEGGLWPLESPWHERLGVLLGTASAGSGPLTEFLRVAFTDGPSMAPPAEFPNTVANAPASQVSILNKITGPNTTLSQKQAVLGPALRFGRIWLEDRRCDALLLGASDEWNPYYELGYRDLGSLRTTVEGTDEDGFLLGEGSGVLLIETAEQATRRGAEPLARILGIGCSSSPGPTYQWIADADALARAIEQALREAALEPAAITTVVSAANGVRKMDRAEAQALDAALPGADFSVYAIKGVIGESAAASVASLAVAARCRHRNQWPEASKPEAASSPDRDQGSTLVLASSAGGNYAAVVVD